MSMVTRCVCKNVDFRTIAAMRRGGLTLAQIVQETGCTTGCGMCGPYVRLVISTGRTAHAVLSAAEAERIVREMPLAAPANPGP